MHFFAPSQLRKIARGIAALWFVLSLCGALQAQVPSYSSTRKSGPAGRIPREQALVTAAIDGVVREKNTGESAEKPVPGARVVARNTSTGQQSEALAGGEGVFRMFPLLPGTYEIRVEATGHTGLTVPALSVSSNEVLTLEILLAAQGDGEIKSRLLRRPELGPPLPGTMETTGGSYRELRHRLDADPNYIMELTPESLAPAADVFHAAANRWELAQPTYRRYAGPGDVVYVKPHWYDPFNHNKWKGDEPIWPEVFGQQVFLNFTGTAQTFLEGSRVPAPSGVSAEHPGSSEFFGNGNQLYLDQTFRFSFDLFHGDTSFKPADWRVRVTPVVSLNYLSVGELGIVSPDVQKGSTRFDDWTGLQEAFFEYKLHDLSANYDFISARAGIQEFNADFRGFLFVDEQLGLRVFGNLKNDRIEYNAAYFNFLEKNTNSGLNTFDLRGQQVVLANMYVQDFFIPGYTAEFVGAFNKDDPSVHYDDNGFLVRPAPIGNPMAHGIRVGYFGWLGSGHIKRVNLSHAFYEAAGEDTFNAIAGRSVTVNAQMVAAEASVDRDWARYRVSVFYTSGDANPRDGRAGGFDAIVDLPNFAGGMFSFWNQNAIRLTGTGVALTQPGSLLPNMRSNKEEGQANFVNPGIFIANVGADFDLTPKLKGFANFNYLRFMRTEPIEYALFQWPIQHSIGEDIGIGVQYRPPLSENLVLTGGASMLQPGDGFREIYTGRTQWSVFGVAKFTF